MSCLWRNFVTTSAPKVKETPRSFSPQPSTSLSGSAHNRSHKRPWSGTSVGRMTRRICSIDWRSGDRPEEEEQTVSNRIIQHLYKLVHATRPGNGKKTSNIQKINTKKCDPFGKIKTIKDEFNAAILGKKKCFMRTLK